MRAVMSCVFALVLACGPTPGGGGGNGDGDGDQPDASPDDPVADASIGPDSSCGAQTENIEVVNLGDPPDLLIVLDRSGSMTLAPGFPPFGTSKWNIMRDALGSITQTHDQNIRFGMSMFPTDNLCGVSPGAAVDINLGMSSQIVAEMNSTGPDGNTPAHLGLEEALQIYNQTPLNPEGRYVLFATDGIPNCGGNPVDPDTASDSETVAAVTALSNNGIDTFVLGFGDILGLDPDVLNDSALAGGVPKPGGPPHFYHADNATELEQALEDIAGGIISPSCSFSLAQLPPDPDNVTVTIDGTPVPRDPSHQNGWDYHPDSSTITFFGSYCDQIETGAATGVDFVYGCPGPVVD